MKLKSGNMSSGGSEEDKLREVILGTYGDLTPNIESFDVLPTGIPNLDKILGGGVIFGGTVEIAGLEATGKSTMGGILAARAQERGYPVVYIDTEAAMSVVRLKSLGVDVTKLIYLQPSCLEDVYNYVATVIKAKIENKAFSGPALIVWDSLAATPSRKELETDEYDKDMGWKAKVNSAGLRKLIKPLQNAQICFLVINQYRENIGVMFGDKYVTPGGHGPKFAAIQRLRMSHGGQYDIDKAAGIVGKKVIFKTVKNKVHQPLLEATTIFNNVTGTFDVPISMFEELKAMRRVNSSGQNWVLNLNDDIGDATESGIIKFKRVDFPEIYEEHRQRILDII